MLQEASTYPHVQHRGEAESLDEFELPRSRMLAPQSLTDMRVQDLVAAC